MNNGAFRVPTPLNEPVRSYAPGSPERARIKSKLAELKAAPVEIPAFIGGEAVLTGDTIDLHPPHELSCTLGQAHLCGRREAKQAVAAAVKAQPEWAAMPFEDRAAIFLKAADLLAGSWRDVLNGATMLGQSKNVYQAEIDAACEMIDFFRFNVAYAERLYAEQPYSPPGMWNRMEYRPLEGFVFAVTPFNFTSIQGNLPTAPALLGNTVVWKPATSALYSAYFLQRLLEEAGLPPGVINMVPGHGADVGDPVFASPAFAGLHFTGSTGTFQRMWRTISEHLPSYKSYPRIVGETGGKDFILAHPSADPLALATAMLRGAFEYQGQKCSAASRCYIPRSLWPTVREAFLGQLSEVRMGSPEDFGNFMNAVIDRNAYESIVAYIDHAHAATGVEVLHGGRYDADAGYFIEPTVLLADDPGYQSMCEEIFGPVLTLHVYDDGRWSDVLHLVDETSPYALTGAVFARDRRAVIEAGRRLVNAAGNFYINDKPTGAVVGQQPFGGGRASGTNDKAGSFLNLVRWINARAIKETFDPATNFKYPFMQPED